MNLKVLFISLIIVVGLCIGVWAIAQTTQIQGGHTQDITKALENAGITPATSTSPSR